MRRFTWPEVHARRLERSFLLEPSPRRRLTQIGLSADEREEVEGEAERIGAFAGATAGLSFASAARGSATPSRRP